MKISRDLLIFLAIILVSLAVPMVVKGAVQPNDYVVWVFSVQDFKMQDENLVNIEYAVGYIPIQAGSTYTYTRANLVTQINLTQPTQINSRMKTTIMDFAYSKGYNIKKIVYQDYNIVTP